MILGKIPNLQSYHPTILVPKVLFYTESLIVCPKLQDLFRKTGSTFEEKSQQQKKKPLEHFPTSQSSNPPTVWTIFFATSGTDSPLQSAVHFEPRVSHHSKQREKFV